jgi:Domain of unknown function (DUF4145)
MMIKVDNYSNTSSGTPVNLRCPACRHKALLETVLQFDVLISGPPPNTVAGLRRCPDPQCRALIFFVKQDPQILATYPVERIDFGSTNIPPLVLSAIEESVTCHANQCYVASAIMVRKTLELMCADRGVTGNNLKEKLQQLRSSVVLPQELLDATDKLRLLGNDAAHIESQTYNKVGKDEVEIALEVAKEVLKGVYQYAALLEKLKNLTK